MHDLINDYHRFFLWFSLNCARPWKEPDHESLIGRCDLYHLKVTDITEEEALSWASNTSCYKTKGLIILTTSVFYHYYQVTTTI
jgi:hypothetical protein